MGQCDLFDLNQIIIQAIMKVIAFIKIIGFEIVLAIIYEQQILFKVRGMISMVTIYVLFTLALFSFTVYEQLQRSYGYFTAVLTYMANDMNVLILYNLAVTLAIILYKIFIWVFFDKTLEGQIVKITDRLKIKIFDVVLFSYIIGMKLDFQAYLVIVLLIFLYILHNNLAFRSEHLIHAHSTSLSLTSHYKILTLFIILFFFDYQILKLRALKFLSINQPTQGFFIYYMFETSMIIAQPFFQFFFDFYEKYTFSHIKNSQQTLAIIGLVINIPKLTIQLLMSLWITYKFSQPAFLFISSLNILIQLKDAIQSFSRVRKLTTAMSLLKKIQGEQLQKFHDLTCTVCYDDMKDAVMLPCKHIFHEECMRQWIIKNFNHFCPKCKREFNFDRIKDQYRQIDGAIGEKAQFDHFQTLFTKKNSEEDQQAQQNRMEQQLSQEQREEQRINNNQQKQIEKSSLIRQTKRQKQFKQKQFGQKSRLSPSKRQIVYERQALGGDLSQYPLQFYEQMKKNVVRVGGLPYGLPTMAVNHRNQQHMKKRRHYGKEIDVVLRLMNMSHNEQLLFL